MAIAWLLNVVNFNTITCNWNLIRSYRSHTITVMVPIGIQIVF